MDCAQIFVAGRFGFNGCSSRRRRLAAGADPYWAGALYNLCTVVLLAALFGFAALGLVWRTVKRMSERLHFEARGKFQLEASRALFRRSGVLVGIVIAAEVVMYMLRLWAAR